MNEQDPNGRTHPSRRSVLRKGALVASLGTVGLPAVTGPAAATNDCPRPPAYWRNNWTDKFGSSVTIPPAGRMTKDEIRTVLWTAPGEDTVTIVAKHYVATYLNLMHRPDPDLACANLLVEVEGIGIVHWEHVKNAAQGWLRLNGWNGGAYSDHRSWSPSVAVDGRGWTVDGETLKDALAAFNNAQFDDLDCDCDGDEPDFTDGNGEEFAGEDSRRDSSGRGSGRLERFLRGMR